MFVPLLRICRHHNQLHGLRPFLLPLFLCSLLFESMYPVRKQIISQINDRTDTPRQRIGPEYIPDFLKQPHHNDNINNSNPAPDNQHDKHRHKRLPRAPAYSRHRMGKGKQKIEKRNDARLHHAAFYNARRFIEQSYKLRRKDVIHNADCFRRQHSRENRKTRARFGPFELSRAKILADKGSCRHIKTVYGKEYKSFYFGVNAISGHRQPAKGVNL